MTEQQREFEDGAQVQLKSGGPVMTVVSYAKHESYSDALAYFCKWWDQSSASFKTDSFRAHELVRYSVPSVGSPIATRNTPWS